MSKMVIFGGKRLFGELCAAGAKNAALPILFAALLIDKEPIFLENIPDISDVRHAVTILESVGASVEKGRWISDIHTESLPGASGCRGGFQNTRQQLSDGGDAGALRSFKNADARRLRFWEQANRPASLCL